MKQGEVWLIDLEPTRGSEIKKARPCIIVNDNDLGTLPLKIIVPLTDWKDRYTKVPWMVKTSHTTFNNLTKDSAADCFQIRSVAEERLTKRLGIAESEVMEEIRKALALILTIR
jgi:mRNA interferase MazF